MELRQLEYFVTSVEEGSFYQASKKLYTSQPAISKAIARLENDLNASLFIRSKRGLQMTAKGEKLYHYAKNILHQVELIENDEDAHENLRVSSYPSLKIAVALTDFYNKQSDYFELDYREGTVQDIINNTKLGISEIGILYISPNQEETFAHILSHSDLEFVPILESELVVYVGNNHPYYGRKEGIHVDEISEFQYIRGLRDFFSVEHQFDYVNLNEINTSKFQDVVVTNSDHLVSHMLEKTNLCYLGINVKNQDVPSKIHINSEKKSIKVGYIKRKMAVLSKKSEEFVAILKEHI